MIDAMGRIKYATGPAAALVALSPEEATGRSVLEFVSEESAWAYAATVAMATEYADVRVGPLRVALAPLPGEAEARPADLWAANCLDDPEIEGIVCLLTAETTSVWLGEAVEAASESASLATIANHVVTAMRGHPVVADAVLLAPRPDQPGRLMPLVSTQLNRSLFDGDGPWSKTLASGIRSQWEVEDLPATSAHAARLAGYEALWVEPVFRRNASDTVAVLLLWRSRPGGPSPNQLSSIHQGASVLRLCWSEI